jgi:hypothetical protein
MFVLCVMYSKDKMQSQDKEVQLKYREQKKSRRGHGCLSVMSLVCVCVSGRGLCDGLITRPEESYRMCRVIVSLCVISKPQK